MSVAFSLKITSARQCGMGLAAQPDTPGGYVLVVDYAVQAQVGGSAQDILVAGAEQRVSTPVVTGKPMLTPAQVAALIRRDCQATFGGQPDTVSIDGTSY